MKKHEVLDKLETTREAFLDAIDGLSEEELQQPGVVGDWSVKDIISHLISWEAELVKLLWQAQQGQQPSSIHFEKGTVDEKNVFFQQQTNERPLERVMADFGAVRKQTMRRVEALKDADLSDLQRYSWLRGEPLWRWIADDSFGHEEEHTAQITAWRVKPGK